MTVRDFVIDAPKLVARHARVSLVGYYIGGGHAMLFDSQQDVIMMRYASPPHIAFLFDNASRSLRARILSCDADPSYAQIGCRIEIKGRAQMCSLSFMGSTEAQPCIIAEDGGEYVPPPPPPPTAAQLELQRQLREQSVAQAAEKQRQDILQWEDAMSVCINALRQRNLNYPWEIFQRCAGGSSAHWPDGAPVPHPLPATIQSALEECMQFMAHSRESLPGANYKFCTNGLPPQP
jgi:hypothetical protein